MYIYDEQIGRLLSACMPFLFSALHATTGNWTEFLQATLKDLNDLSDLDDLSVLYDLDVLDYSSDSLLRWP